MTPGIINRRQGRRTSKKRNGPNRPQPSTPISITNVTKAAAVLTITFNQPVALKGIPAYLTNLAGITPVLASMTNPTTLSLTFSATVATATSLVVPFEEGAVRNPSGGFVNAGTFPVIPSAPAALVMVEATFDPSDGVYLRLTFDRAIDASGLNGAAITQGVQEYEYLYNATGGFIMIDPATIEFTMVQIGSWEFGDFMHATSANGIVAVDDGGTWAGVPDTGLPFP